MYEGLGQNGNCVQTDEVAAPIAAVRSIRFKKLNYGYLVEVDCHSFAIESKEKLIAQLTEYINNPEAKEDEWYKNKTL